MIRMQVCIFGFRLLFVQDFFARAWLFFFAFFFPRNFFLVLAGISFL